MEEINKLTSTNEQLIAILAEQQERINKLEDQVIDIIHFLCNPKTLN